MTMIFAHRGFSGYYPENTMLAFQKVLDETVADGIEMDVQLTKDGEVVIMHDETLDRTTNGSGNVRDYTLAELKMLSVGVNFKGILPRQTIPTLREYLAWMKPTHLITNIELKTSIYDYPGIEEKVIALVREFGLQDRIIYSSFNHYTVKRVKELEPTAKCGLLVDDWLYNAGKYCQDFGAFSLNPLKQYALHPGFCDELHEYGIQTMVWTPNTMEELQTLVDNHCDILITNYADRAAKVLGRTK